MAIRTSHCAALLFAPFASAWSQSDPGDERATPTGVSSSPTTVVSSPAQPRRLGPVEEFEGVDGGELEAAPVAYEDDSVPRFGSEIVESRDDGDVLVQPASGDPYFLGFAAGAYFPPREERVDQDLVAQLRSQWTDGRPAQETYAFVMFGKRMTPERIAALEAAGCRTLGFHPHYTLKVALAPKAIDEVLSLDFVRWIGAPKSWQKVHPRLVEELAIAQPGEQVDVWVNVYDSDLGAASTSRSVGTEEIADQGTVVAGAPESPARAWTSNGWQQRSLQALGLDVHEYVDSIRAFRARMAPASLEQVVALDFVQFVEADLPQQLLHDESTPLALTDYGRGAYDGGVNDVAIAAEIDSGMESSHTALNHVFGVGWNFTSDPNGAFDDGCGHGSHVAGTILGLPDAADEGYTGNAPGLGGSNTLRVRNARFFDDACNASGSSVATLFGVMEASYTDGSGNVSAKPHAINCSWGTSPSTPWIGSEADARTLDAEVLTFDQLYVFAAGNSGSGGGTIGLPACAKNAFTVASVLDYRDTEGDPGSLRTTSSRGPCGDDRWKPNVAAPGKWIRSVDAATASGFTDMSGTSMAAPHVTGLAAQLCDRYSFFRYAPHRLASVLMASAMTNNDASLSAPSTDPAHHYNTFGAGRINAHKAHVGTSDWTWTNWTVTLSSGSSTNADFDVLAGTTRLVVCMTYHEAAASSGASAALVNDLDLWIDSPAGGIDPANNTGEYFAHQSPRDNTEIRYISSPVTGTWRWKIWPDSTSSTSTVSVTVGLVSADTTPDGTLSVTANDTTVQPNVDVTITAAAYNPEYYASCVFLDTTSAGDALQSSTTTLEDGIVTDLMTNQHGGRDVTLGTIRPGDTRTATWVTRWATEGVKSWSVSARSDNWIDETGAVNVTVDGTVPGIATNLTSSTHAANVWSSNPNIAYVWTAATDALSGVDGYGIFTSQTASGAPSTVKDIEEVTTYAETLSTASNGWYFKLRTVDNSENWSPANAFAVTGPYLIDTQAPSGPTGLASTTHTPGVQSCNTTVTVNWTAPADPHSGVANQYLAVNTIPVFDPTGGAILSAGATSYTSNIGSSTNARYYHLRARDVAGNWGTTQHFGPVYANANSVATYCVGKVNSLGCTPAISSLNQPSRGAGNFAVKCSNTINNRFGLLFWGSSPTSAPFQGGTLCVNAPVVRTPIQDSGGTPPGIDDCSGIWSFTFDNAYMTAYGMDPGETFYGQWWGRDPQSPSTTSLSNAIQFTVCE